MFNFISRWIVFLNLEFISPFIKYIYIMILNIVLFCKYFLMHLSFDIFFLDSTYTIQGLAHARKAFYHWATSSSLNFHCILIWSVKNASDGQIFKSSS
jgi:hypothetical protein